MMNNNNAGEGLPGVPPPLPPRPNDPAGPSTSSMNPYAMGGMYNNPMLGGYNAYQGTMGGYGMYGNSMYGGGMPGVYGGARPGEVGFARLAEESSRDAFRSIDAVVNAVSSVAMMLSSTQNAVYSSFRAVIGVVEQFSTLKQQLTSLLVSLWVFRWCYRMWRRLLVLLRLKPASYYNAAEMAWGEIQHPLGTDVLGPPSRPTSVNWPAAIFWVVAMGGPYLIYKCVSRMVNDAQQKRQWAVGSGPHYTATAIFDFHAGSEQELSFMAGETLRIAPKEEQPRVRGWLLASSKEGDRIGLVPINYVKVVSRQTYSPPPEQSSTSLENLNLAFQNTIPEKR